MRRGSFVAAACLGLALAPAVSAAETGRITAVGWWSQRPGASELPAGGFEVALLPNAPQSVAALRVDAGAAPAPALLELTEAEQVLGDAARLQICPTRDSWKPANPGAWADAPTADCEAGSVTPGRNAEGRWTADVGSLLAGGSTSLMVVPLLEVTDEQQSFAFRVTFSGARLTSSAPEGGSASAPPASPAATFPPAPSLGPATDPPTTSFPLSEPATTASAPATAAAPPAATSFAAPEEPPGEPKPWWRLAIGLPLSLVAGGGAVYVRRWLREREMLGG